MPVDRPATVSLGKSPIQITPVAVGTWSWGDAGGWEFGKTHTEKDLAEVVSTITAVSPNFLFDTAEGYGGGASEEFLGKFLREFKATALIATKFSPRRFDIRRKDLCDALRGSLRRLGVKQIDLYQIHWPTRFSSTESRMAALADAVEEGLVRAVGVCNFSRDQILSSCDALARRKLTLATVQVEYSLIHRNPETNGVLDLCRERGITLLAYSPMAMGMLTGKYSADRLPPAPRRGKYSSEFLSRIQPLIDLMKKIGARHGQRSPAQVALNWVRDKGAVPIAGAKTKQQAEEALQSLEWNLTGEDMAALDAASDSIHRP
jgi:aryl-alcohol dehydrogenase-like predicted oxidoreductase